jgi:transposase InsO family protein
MALPQGPNQRWSLDFVSDAFGCGRRFRILCVVDDFTRECLALVPDTSLSGARVARELDMIAAIRGKPLAVVSDNGANNGADIGLDPALVARAAGGMALHRAGQADPECVRRKLQRKAAR